MPLQVVTIDNCSFYYNTAKVGGATFAFDLKPNVQVTIGESVIINNTAYSGAAIYAGNRYKPDHNENR